MLGNFGEIVLRTGLGQSGDTVAHPAPQDIILNGDSIDESSLVGALIGTAMAIDPTGAPFTWLETSDPDDKFSIDANTGVITLSALVDFETKTSHSYAVQVMNRFGQIFEKTFTISVLDFDDGQPAAAPANVVLPSITGDTRVGHVLIGHDGTWTGNAVPGFLYRWLRNGVVIAGAVAKNYTATALDQGALITLEVTGRNATGSTVAISATVGPITASEFLIARYIASSAGGSQSGTSWANAGTISKLNQFILEAGADGIVYIRSDAGTFSANTLQTITHGGTAGHPVTIRGVNVNLVPTLARANGNRTDPWVYGSTTGPEFIRLMAGADHLSFEFLNFTNCGNGCFRVGDNIADLNIESCIADNVNRFVENNISGAATTASITGFTIRNCTVRGFSRAFARIQYDSSAGLIVDCFGDSEEQDGDNFAAGVVLSGTAHNIAQTRVTMMRPVQTAKSGVPMDDTVYWNGDCFSQENGNYGITYTDCFAQGATDGGFDLKGLATLINCVSVDNKKNFRLWGTATLTGCFGADAYIRGGNSIASNVWLSGDPGATVTITDSAFVQTDAVNIFDLDGAASSLTTVNTSIQAAGTVVNNPLNGTVVLDTKTPPPCTVLPVVTGTLTAGQTLSCSTGTWIGAGFTYTYRWKLDGRYISEATTNTLLLGSAQIGGEITCSVYAKTSAGYVGEATSLAAGAVAGTAPTIDGSFISGLPRVGSVLTANPGTVTGFPYPTLSYYWRRDGVTITGNVATYTVVAGDLGHTISFSAGATNSSGSDSFVASGVVITAAVVGSLYIGPARAGLADGSSWANRGRLSDLNSFIAGSLAGSNIYLAADLGTYTAGTTPLNRGGSGSATDATPDPANFINIKGVNSNLTPAMATFIGSRTDWTNYPAYVANNETVTSVSSWSAGSILFQFTNGANYLTFDHIRGERIGNGLFNFSPTDPGDGSDWLHHIHLTNIEGFNCQRMLEMTPGSTKVGFVLIKDWNCIGFSKGEVRIRGAAHDWLVQNAYGDSGRQDRDDFAMGVHCDDTAHNIEHINCEIINCHDTTSSYWNGDGFTAETDTYNLYWEDCRVSGCTDAGIDTKQEVSTADWLSGSTSTYRLRATHTVHVLRGTFANNKKSIKTFHFLDVQDVVIGGSIKRGGSGSACQFSLSGTDTNYVSGITATGCTLSGAGRVVEFSVDLSLCVLDTCVINSTGTLFTSGTDIGHVRLIDCTGTHPAIAAIAGLPDYTVPTYRSSQRDASPDFAPSPLMPFGKKGDICIVVGLSDSVAGTIDILGIPGDGWTHEVMATSGGVFASRIAWRRLEGTEYGTIDTNNFGPSGTMMRLTAAHVFAGCKPTGTPYEGYGTLTTNGGAPAVVVTGSNRMVAHIHSCSDNVAFGSPPAGYTQAWSDTTTYGSDGGDCLDIKAGVGAGTAAATTRAVSGTPTICHAFALIPVAG